MIKEVSVIFRLCQIIQPLLLTLSLTLAGCASVPRNSHELLSWYRAFLIAQEQPFSQRVFWHLGLRPDADPIENIGMAINLHAPKGQPILSSLVRFDRIEAGLYQGRMWTEIDNSIMCVKFHELNALGRHLRSAPIMIHERRPDGWFGVTRIEHEPDYIEVETKANRIIRVLVIFEKGCLHKLQHGVLAAVGALP